jgi:3-hydroxybutyryl-CoA dehydrogenase
LNKRIQNWGLTENEKKIALSRVQGTTKYKDFTGCDFVIEAVRYDDQTGERHVEERKEVFLQLEKVLSPQAIIASNVSTVVNRTCSELQYKERCIGLHFLSNVPGSNIIEIVRGLYTSDETYEKICQFARLINHQYVAVAESAGLVSIRLFLIELNEACEMLMEGISNVEDMTKFLPSVLVIVWEFSERPIKWESKKLSNSWRIFIRNTEIRNTNLHLFCCVFHEQNILE